MFIEVSICILNFSDFERRFMLRLCLNAKGLPSPKYLRDQWRGHEGTGENPPPHFCEDGARNILKIDGKVGVGRGL